MMKRFIPLILIVAMPALAADPAPGTRFRVDVSDLPAPFATPSVANPADVVARPPGAGLKLPPGWRATLFATGLDHPRNLLVLSDNSVLVAEQRFDRLTRLVDGDGDGIADSRTTLAAGFDEPFGLAERDGEIWVADTKAVWALPWRAGEDKAGRRRQVTTDGALGDDRGHSTRSLVLHPDGSRFYVGIGSRGNVAEEAEPRATVRVFAMDGSGGRSFASGLRNPVGMAFRPGSTELWAVVNERDGLGDELVPDYLTWVVESGFYGWPYAYLGPHPQPGLGPKAADKVAAARVPDILFRAHSAPLGLAFAHGDAFVGLHGSWNRSEPIGYMVARVPFKDGKPVGHYEAFASGFMAGPHAVWGRPVGVAAGADGALYVADDAGRTVWKLIYSPKTSRME
ncbi:putative L-sorbosone dehydrogenase [Magnetospirillum gryphiswaldense MSR-1 v2]|uniref:L-sorbosone dehydrogenase n=1 Tax=Magnetospirillum gryphiswaldense (strain DSM 6361 / JCM 21280 / NBRC 15271 / MSR-1) TaxID=431944 RepID=V6F6J9_MAGGM|nr:PQQ-dependent sugar dehydrogenase [Magnetospirillum gryphiswaldense]CDL00118.1 putative L-sorbosone dehydrogenase [Magnetospirillum gryphiswaldense MSR-1 v2]